MPEKRKQYNRKVYLARKEKDEEKQRRKNREAYEARKEKLMKLANGEGSSQCTSIITNSVEVVPTPVVIEQSRRVQFGMSENHNGNSISPSAHIRQSAEQLAAKKRAYSREYYQRKKQKQRMTSESGNTSKSSNFLFFNVRNYDSIDIICFVT